jgi:hypothetical protein
MATPPSNIQRVHPLSEVALRQYVSSEAEAIKTRQASVEAEISDLTKKLAALKESYLILGGALQGLQHVGTFIEKHASSSEDPAVPPSAEPVAAAPLPVLPMASPTTARESAVGGASR